MPVVQRQEQVKLAPAVPGSELKVEQVDVPAIPENPTPHEWKDVLGQVKKGFEQSQWQHRTDPKILKFTTFGVHDTISHGPQTFISRSIS